MNFFIIFHLLIILGRAQDSCVHVESEDNFLGAGYLLPGFEVLDSDHADMASTVLSLLVEPLC